MAMLQVTDRVKSGKPALEQVPSGSSLMPSGSPTSSVTLVTQRDSGGIVQVQSDSQPQPQPPRDRQNWSWKAKWRVILVIFIVQISMNFNAAVYGFAKDGIKHQFGASDVSLKLGSFGFLAAYAFGCELWAPFSEEYGRKKIMQASLWLVNIWGLLAWIAWNERVIIAARILGGLSSAGGSVTLAVVADMYTPWLHHPALATIVLSSCGGSVVGPLVGAPLRSFAGWRWVFGTQVIFGAVTALIHLCFCPETDVATIKRKWRRKQSTLASARSISSRTRDLYGGLKEICRIETLKTMSRPFIMLVLEPIVTVLSLLSGFSDMLVFLCLESFDLVMEQYAFSPVEKGLAFAPFLAGNILGYALHFIDFSLQRRDIVERYRLGKPAPAPERRLSTVLLGATLLLSGLLLFALTSTPQFHWTVPLAGCLIVGIANFNIYMTTIDYMVAAYGARYAASATGGNGFSRDLLAGIAVWYAKPLYQIGSDPLRTGSLVLCGLAGALLIMTSMVYWYGPQLRKMSKLAEGLVVDESPNLQSENQEKDEEKNEEKEKATRGQQEAKEGTIVRGKEQSQDKTAAQYIRQS